MNKERDIFDDNLHKEAPLLNRIPKSNPFTVPEGYFDALPALIMDKCREGTKRVAEPIADKIFWLFRPQWMIAAFILVAGLSLFLRQGGNTSFRSYQSIAANIPDSVIMQNLQNNIDYVDVNTLEEATQNSGKMPSLQPAQDTNNKQIINYLMNNNVDASDIENEL